MSNLSDIGFPVQSEQDVNQVIENLLSVVERFDCPGGAYYIYRDKSGAEMYLQSNLQDELIGFNPHFAGKSRRTVRITRIIERDSSELDGGFYAWANPHKGLGESGDYPFVFDVPDFRANTNTELPRVCEIQLTAFASNDFRIYADEQEYKDNQESELKYAAKSFVPSGLFTFDEADSSIDLSTVRPICMLSGEVKEYELKINQLTNEKFYRFWIDTFGGEADVVADPKLITKEPQTGGIISGQFWLSGRLIES
ncbi:MAG TPA: hypothetical protein VF556_03070 [Pyrinomonadaceae bacterium]|jgi:hypothetical protein